MEQGSTSLSPSTSDGTGYGNSTVEPKHQVFLSHSGAQKGFVEQLCVDLKRCDRRPFFDKDRDCLPIGKDFPSRIFEAIEHCEVGVVVLSEDFFTSKWPMLELVAMAEVKKRRPNFTFMPIYLGISFSECRNVGTHKRWLSLWQSLAEGDNRIDLKDWEDALQLFGPTNGLKYNYELGEVEFREEIVEAICKLVPPGTRFEDSYVQGRSRLCKVIHQRLEEWRISSDGVCLVGIYGVGGIGKTTICKAMCNDFSKEYQVRVAHVELGSQSEVELLKKVLVKLSNKNPDQLGAMDVDEYRHHLMRDMVNVKVFLTIDNVSSATSNQALSLLDVKYGPGSALLVTARSLDELMSLGINESQCMEMPELELEEAKSLFLSHARSVPAAYTNNKDDHDLISSCVERCRFGKGDGISYHYHPLALKVLGEQFRRIKYDRERWKSLLQEIDSLNPFGEPQHPVFSILRISFDALNTKDQLLFMDVALFDLFAPYIPLDYKTLNWDLFEWLATVHGLRVTSVMERLENLKRKSVVENLGDGLGGVGMHDLWREFARLETTVGKFEERRWIFEWDQYNALEEAGVNGDGCFGNLRRMFISAEGLSKLGAVNCPLLTVLKLHLGFASVQASLDLRGLKHLRILELESKTSWLRRIQEHSVSVVGLGCLSQLAFLRWCCIPSDSSCIDEIGCLTNLRVLDLWGCDRLPDLSRLISLQVACFRDNDSTTTIAGLTSKHTNLQFLDLGDCRDLQNCPGVGELVALQELHLDGCTELQEVPNLRKLQRLRKLHVDYCWSLRALPGLGDLVSLLELSADQCHSLEELPDMRNLRNLRVLRLEDCRLINSLPGLDELVCLESLHASRCRNLTHLPDLSKLTNLETLKLYPSAPLQSSAGWSDLVSLRSLDARVGELNAGLDLLKLTKLEDLHISGWQGRGFSSLAELVLLKSVTVEDCKGVRELPDLKRLSGLRRLGFRRCEFEDLSGLCNLASLEKLQIIGCDKLESLPDLRELARLETLSIKDCARLSDLRGMLGLCNLRSLSARGLPGRHENLRPDRQQRTGLYSLDVSDSGFVDLQWLAACSQLRDLNCSGCPIQELPEWLAACSQLRYLNCSGCPIQQLPDLASFPNLSALNLNDCVNLTNLTCMGLMSPHLTHLDVRSCMRLQALPDLTNSRTLICLDVSNSGVVLSAELIQDMKARWPSLRLLTGDTSSDVRALAQPRVRRQGSSGGLWRRIVGVIASLRCVRRLD